MSILRPLWKLLDSRQRRHLLALQLLSVAMALSTVGGIAAVLPFFAALSDPETIRHNAFAWAVLQKLNVGEASIVPVLGAAFAASVLLANAINLFGLLAINRFSVRVGETLYSQLFAEYLRRGYEFHARHGSSLLASKVQESARVTSGIVQYALVLVASLVTIAFIVAAVVSIDPIVAVAAMTGLGASYAALYAVARKRLWRNGSMEHQLRNERMRTVIESFGAIKEVALLGVQDFFAARFAQQSRRISSAGANTFAIAQTPKYVLECLTVACLIAVALYLRGRVAATGPWVGQLTFVGFAAYRLLPALQQAFTAIVNIRTDRAAFASVERELDDPRAERNASYAVKLDQAWHGRPRREIRLCDVSFRYSSELPPVLSDVSLVIPVGAIVGFKGANGSGKTTLLDVVSGLLMPHSGHVEVDGMRLRSENTRSWQSSIAYVPQHLFLLEASLAENIAFGVPRARIDHDRLRRAAHMACLADCIAGFPAGYEERIGQGGRGLSGGERQRVAIARALYRDASMLLLDEATSSLDSSSESDIGEMLQSLRVNRTVLIVAHRAGALHHCDIVYELAAGKIVGQQSRLSPVSLQAGNG
ncbi:MAG TPA: ABC transporter ATP-binding protein [Steroidobacteraceae bacterium]|jgi:ATP-binding cassette subfamily B protein